MAELVDGTYEAQIVNAKQDLEGGLMLELAISTGENKGDVVSMRASRQRFDRDAEDLLGLPAILTVRYGVYDLSLA